MMTLRIGRRIALAARDLEQASALYCNARDASGEGSSTFPEGRVGKYRISYNGRVWDGKWFDGQRPVYLP